MDLQSKLALQQEIIKGENNCVASITISYKDPQRKLAIQQEIIEKKQS